MEETQTVALVPLHLSFAFLRVALIYQGSPSQTRSKILLPCNPMLTFFSQLPLVSESSPPQPNFDPYGQAPSPPVTYFPSPPFQPHFDVASNVFFSVSPLFFRNPLHPSGGRYCPMMIWSPFPEPTPFFPFRQPLLGSPTPPS